MQRAGALSAWALLIAAGALGLVLSLTRGIHVVGDPESGGLTGSLNEAIVGALFVIVLIVGLLPRGHRRGRGLFLGVLLALAVSMQLSLSFLWRVPPTGSVPGATLLVAGTVLLALSEQRRRNIRADLEAGRLVVRAVRQETEHTLPLETVREVKVQRGAWGRLWGYADLVAHVRQGTMAKHIEKPLLIEGTAQNALMGNGWDEEGRFVMKAAHPYKKVKRQLENQIRLARLPPKEREEAELAERLSEDLEAVRL